MAHSAPSWWYPREAGAGMGSTLLPWLLSPVSALYGSVSGYRMRRAPAYVPSLPVICIGNFTAGGTGKTPLALDVATRLIALGAKPAFLTRGYGGTLSGPYDVNPATDSAARTGDEPLLLARRAPTVICRDRVVGAKHIERSGASVIIMDDGMQNPAIAKTLTLAVVDGSRGLGNGWTIPSGPLRAPLDAQIAVPDAIVMNGDHASGAQTLPQSVSAPVFTGTLQPAANGLNIQGVSVTAFSGIGNPTRFFETLERSGASIQRTFSFPDHHAFTEADAEKILAAANGSGQTIVTTEKDHVRLHHAQAGSQRRALYERSLPLQVTFLFASADSARLDAMLDMLVRQTAR